MADWETEIEGIYKDPINPASIKGLKTAEWITN